MRCAARFVAHLPASISSFLPKATQIIGYARTSMSVAEFHTRLAPYIKGDSNKVERFLKLCTYMHGDVSGREWAALCCVMCCVMGIAGLFGGW